MSDLENKTVTVLDTEGNERVLEGDEFEEFFNLLNSDLDTQINIEEITVSMSVKRQAIKYEADNSYFQSTKLVGISDVSKHYKSKGSTPEDKAKISAAISKNLINRIRGQFKLIKAIINEQSRNDNVPIRHLGDGN